MFSSSSNRKAFTLVETLITVGIIALLAAMVLASYRPILNRAGSAKAQSHLRAMGGALSAHAAENDGRLIEGAMGPVLAAGEINSPRGPAVVYWFNALDFYMEGKDYTLAGMKNPARPAWQRDPLKPYPEMKVSSGGYGLSVGFGWNHQYFGYDSTQNPANGTGWGTRLGSVDLPARTIIIGTNEDSLNDSNPVRNVMIYGNAIRCRRHNGGGYYLFLDGHVERLTPEEVMADNSFLMKRQK